ncbi:hypothetical protein [Virgisporangium ochraceum]|nr:hypothetical protein [Virgisporangium ochraceum]
MAGLLPQMSLEPAPGYRRFVERHFDALRRDACRLAGDGPDVDEVCTDVLTDVALRWRWFELLRVRLRRSDPAGEYLGVALARRIARWNAEPPADADGEPFREVRVEAVRDRGAGGWPSASWYPDGYAVDPDPPPDRRPTGPAATSAAVRIAAVRPLPPHTPSAAVEAVIAWLHAYEMYGRYRRVLAGAAVAVGTAMLLTLRGTGAGS